MLIYARMRDNSMEGVSMLLGAALCGGGGRRCLGGNS